MATEEDGGNGLEFLTDPVDRFPLPDLASSDFTPPSNRDSIIPGSAYDSSMGDVGDAPLSIQLVANAGGDAPTLSTTDSQLSTGKDDPQTAGWAKRVCVGRAPVKRLPCAGRVCALEKTLRCYAEKKTDTVVVPPIGYTFDSLGEAYDFYNLYSWEIGFGIRYGKSRLNVERSKCMQEIVCGCSGKPKRGNTRTCRCECPAMIRLLRSADNS
uniref:Protein FAR1-RELATED SEQUENCE n=1 Tax=Hordeum vulgare subsp. vulgare TaxID=112509 RepID=A0A8I6XEH5_HORVV